MDILNTILEKVTDDNYDKVADICDSITFKMRRSHYHFENIRTIIKETNFMEIEDFYASVNLPIYFEMESLLVSLRSTVDLLMHLINQVFELRLSDVYINNVFKHPSLPSEIKNILRKYTRTFDNTTWSFIYTSRNDIVHEKSIPQVLPITIDPFQFSEVNAFFHWDGMNREIISFLNQSLKFLTNFSNQLYENILISM